MSSSGKLKSNSLVFMENKTHFGFKEVNKDDKSNLVKQVFSGVAHKYDLMNDLMSFGVHRLWKKKMVDLIDLPKSSQPAEIIDVAGGTGDIAFRIIEKGKKENIQANIQITDINQEMLDVGRQRAIDANLINNCSFICCDGEKLEFADNSFDYFTIAFGIRNFTNIDKALSEAHRVLKKGGKFVCLEFSKVNDYFLQQFYDFYSFNIIPEIGEKVLNDKDSYQYLVESIRKFPSQERFKQMITDAGFKNATYQNLTFGTVAIHSGIK